MSIKHEMLIPKNKTKNENQFKKPLLIYVYGGRGSGKSTLVMNLIYLFNQENDYDEDDALFISANNKDPLLENLNFPVSDKPEMLDNFILKVKNSKDKSKKYLLILDDLMSSPDYNIMGTKSSFLNFVLNARHYGGGCSIIVTAQAFNNSFAPVLKSNVNMWFLYSPKNKKETLAITNFFDDSTDVKKALDLLKITNEKNEKEDKPRTFLYINNIQPKTRFFLGFKDELKDL